MKHSIKAGYKRGRFWIPLDNQGSVSVYSGPPMNKKEIKRAIKQEGDTNVSDAPDSYVGKHRRNPEGYMSGIDINHDYWFFTNRIKVRLPHP